MAKREKMTEGRRLTAKTAALVDGLISSCDRITSSNVSHNAAGLKGALMSLANIVREHDSSRIDRLLARERNKAAWDVMLNAPEESRHHWCEQKYGPRKGAKG